VRLAASFVVSIVLFGGTALAEEIQQWRDEQGRLHFSNRGPSTEPPKDDPPQAPGGWESVLERREGNDEFSQRADSVINALEGGWRRKKRERDRARETLDKTQAEIVRLQDLRRASAAYALRPSEEAQVREVNRLDIELAQIRANIDRAKAIKAMGREQAQKLGENPFFQFGQ